MKKAFIIFFILSIIPIMCGVLLVGYVATETFYGDYSDLKKEKIVEILSKETMVFYSDGVSQLGSLFGQEHRQYVTYREIPKVLLDAIVSAEDDAYYRHFGMDVFGNFRAVYKNIFFGKHEGASTITQQTVKNLYGRKSVNLMVKLRETINAFKLERLYSKQEILEFYLNQFHVSGNGRGVGVASKYFFDKDIADINVVEAAFIAGSLKAPYKYTPFVKKSIEAQNKAKDLAKTRKNYVLKRMFELGYIAKDVYEKSKEAEVPFKQGKFQFNDLSSIDLVQRQLTKPEILKAIGVDNSDQIGTLGLRITTTFNKKVQNAAQYGVRQNLSRLEMILSGFKKETANDFISVQSPEKYGFYVAQIKNINKENNAESIHLSLGVSECTAPADAITRVATFLDMALYKGLPKAKANWLNSIAVGDFVLVSVREVDTAGQNIICDIERKPKIQGGLIAVDKGKVVAMVSGYAPYEYNRAILAKRQPGSTFKTLTYYPAMQLGWSALDRLLNVRELHQWQNQFYFPRPDHMPETMETTLAGAGAKSENLASIWLLHHLTYKLNFDQFLDLLKMLGYYNGTESGEDVLARIGNKFNIRLIPENFRGAAFMDIKNSMLDDIDLLSQPELRIVLSSMNFGMNNDSPQALAAAMQKGLSPKEHEIRMQLLRNNYLRWDGLAGDAARDFARLQQIVDQGTAIPDDFKKTMQRFQLSSEGNFLAYNSEKPYQPNLVSPLMAPIKYQQLSADMLLKELDLKRTLLSLEDLHLDGIIPVSIMNNIKQQMDARVEQVQNMSTLEKLYWHDDFRYSLGMVYAQRMCKEMGFESDIQWVPSYPLGSNVVTLAELAVAYQTMLTGKTWKYFENGSENQILVIGRIEDWNGQLLWEAEGNSHQLVDEFYSSSMLSILRGVVTNGTGYPAHNAIFVASPDKEVNATLAKAKIRIPTFGKTGTTNDYTNATYVGFLPYPETEGSTNLTPEFAYTIAAYVGYDSNAPMRRGGFKVAGGTGALPAWIEAAKALIRETNYANKLNWQDMLAKKITEVPFKYSDDVSTIHAGMHSPQLVEEANTDSFDLTDVNTYSDYAVKTLGSLRLAIPGKIDNGIFTPKRKVSFFRARNSNADTTTPLTEFSDSSEISIDLDAEENPSGSTIPKIPEDTSSDDLQITPGVN